MFIHGKEDTFVQCQMSLENYQACQGEKKLLLVDGANHGMSFMIDKEGYERAMFDCFDEYDGND